MPIHFNEGMPRAGKSYSAMRDYIIPALQKGRKCFVRIDGLNLERIAEAAAVPVESVQRLLVDVSLDELPKLAKRLRDERDALIVIDEIQNTHGKGRQPLDEDWTWLITMHGHNGFDILIMGQVLNDVHTLWRNRVIQKTVFLKLEAVGAGKRYQWSVYKATAPGKFALASRSPLTGVPYEEKYYGTYSSHEDGTSNTSGVLVDKRAVIWNTSFFRFWLPLLLIAGVAGVWFLGRLFSKGADNPLLAASTKSIKANSGVGKSSPGQTGDIQGVQPPTVQLSEGGTASKPLQPVVSSSGLSDLSSASGPRVVALLEGAGGKAVGLLEFGGAGSPQWSFADLRALGWEVWVERGAVRGKRGAESFTAVARWVPPQSGQAVPAPSISLSESIRR